MSDRIAVVNAGRIEQVDAPRAVYQHSATEFVCNFIGDVNRLEPVVSERLVAAGGKHLDPALPSYLRIEKVRILPLGTPAPDGLIAVDGVVDAKEYHGINHSYTVQLARTRIKAVVPEDGVAHHFEVGDKVTVITDSRDVLQYPSPLSSVEVGT